MENKIEIIGKNGQKIEITEAEKEKREKKNRFFSRFSFSHYDKKYNKNVD